jgi:hypothetical protein
MMDSSKNAKVRVASSQSFATATYHVGLHVSDSNMHASGMSGCVLDGPSYLEPRHAY